MANHWVKGCQPVFTYQGTIGFCNLVMGKHYVFVNYAIKPMHIRLVSTSDLSYNHV